MATGIERNRIEPGRGESSPVEPHRVDELLGEIPPGLLEEREWVAGDFGERYANEIVLEAAAALGLEAELGRAGRGLDSSELLARRGFVPEFLPVLSTLLSRLAGLGEIDAIAGASPLYSAPRPLRASRRAAVRDEALARDATMAPALDLLDAALAAYPEVATGRITGDQALLGPAGAALWIGYFDNANPVYSPSNRLAAFAAANRLPVEGTFRILELGAGAGSAAEALLVELERRGRLDALERYALTEPSPFFRRRAERSLRARFPGVRFESTALDVDVPFEQQGIAGRFDLVYGVNVLHVARNLRDALLRIRGALEPGGALVAGECFRLFTNQFVPAELVFQLLRGYVTVELDPELRPHHGFLEPERWRSALDATGFAEVTIVPDLERIRELDPRFFAGALCGRRPVVSDP